MLKKILTMFTPDIKTKRQPFKDCNHHTAYYLYGYVLYEFGYKLNNDKKAIRIFRMKWNELSGKEMELWLRDNTQRTDDAFEISGNSFSNQ